MNIINEMKIQERLAKHKERVMRNQVGYKFICPVHGIMRIPGVGDTYTECWDAVNRVNRLYTQENISKCDKFTGILW